MMVPSPRQRWLLSAYLPYQLRWVLDDSPISLALKGRQLGFSDATAGWIIEHAFYRKEPVVFLSASERIAEEMVQTVKTHCDVLVACGQADANRFKVENAGELAWRSGGRLLSLSSSARTGRSWHGHIIFDEFANHENPEKIWAAAAPMATRASWKLRVISTPAGAQGLFYRWCVSPPNGWTFHRVSLDDAIRDGLDVDREKLLQLVGGDERIFAEAYQLSFLDGQFQYYPTAIVDIARDWIGETPPLLNAVYYAGLDVGRTHDLTALSIVAVEDGVAWLLAVMACKRTDFKRQRAIVAEARQMFRWEKLQVDATGLGAGLAEQLVEDWTEHEVVPVQFTAKVKEDLVTRTFRWLKTGRVRLPRNADGRTIAEEMIAVRRVITNSGNVVYQFGSTPDSHSDRLVSLMLALNAAGEPPVPRGGGLYPVAAVG